MTVTLDTLCGVTALAPSAHLYLIGSGLTPGQVVHMMVGSANPLFDVNTGATATANANGYVTFSVAQGAGSSFDYYLHGTSDTHATDRISNSASASWAVGNPTPSYGTAAVLNVASAGDTIVALQWTAAYGCDVRISSISYEVRRSTSAPLPNPAGFVTTTSGVGYTNTGRTNGTTYWYMVRATIKYVDDLITPLPNDFDSNVLSATPFTSKEIWGAIGR